MALSWATYATPNTGAQFINDIICVGEDAFVAVGTAGTVITSADGGETWTARTAAAAVNWGGLAFDGTTVVAVAYSGATRVMVSTDLGHTWTGKTAAEANSWTSVTYASFLGMFVAVAINGVHRVMTSIDSGTTWVAQTAASAAAWSGVAASPSLVLAIDGTNGALMSSVDGAAWSSASTPTNFSQLISQGSNALVYSTLAGKFAAAGLDSSTGKAKMFVTTTGAAFTYSAGAPLTSYLAFMAFVEADAFGGFLGSLPYDPTATPTPTIIAESTDAAATWTAEDTTFSGLWQVGAWDDVGGTAVFWDGNQTNTMLVGADTSTVDSLTPAFGTSRGGTVVTITGEGFTGVTSVTFGGTAGVGLVVTSDTSLTVVTPAHVVGLFDVIVVGVGTLTNAFSFVEVTRVSPKAGTVAGSTAVTITGFGFNAATGVLFGTVAATSVVIVSTTSITAVTPAHTSGAVDVTVSGVDTGSALYTYTLAVPQVLGKGPLLPPIPTRRGA